jgi:hypothetical protein
MRALPISEARSRRRAAGARARNPVDRNRDRIRQGNGYRALLNRLEVGALIAHLIRASRTGTVGCRIAASDGQRT